MSEHYARRALAKLNNGRCDMQDIREAAALLCDSLIAASEQEGVRCPKCGGNVMSVGAGPLGMIPTGAYFCWHCYQRFEPTHPAAPVAETADALCTQCHCRYPGAWCPHDDCPRTVKESLLIEAKAAHEALARRHADVVEAARKCMDMVDGKTDPGTVIANAYWDALRAALAKEPKT